MRGGNLPLAKDLESGLESFEALRAYAGNTLKISNIEVITPPEWEHILV